MGCHRNRRKKAIDDAKEKLKEIAAHECDLIISVFAKDCRLTFNNVMSDYMNGEEKLTAGQFKLEFGMEFIQQDFESNIGEMSNSTFISDALASPIVSEASKKIGENLFEDLKLRRVAYYNYAADSCK